MTIAKSNRCRELLKELEQIQYDYLDTNMRRLTETEKRFYKHRKKIILKYVSDYLDTENAKEFEQKPRFTTAQEQIKPV